MKVYNKQQEEIAHVKKCVPSRAFLLPPSFPSFLRSSHLRPSSHPPRPSTLLTNPSQVHRLRRYLRQPCQAGQVEAEDYRQDGGCGFGREGRAAAAVEVRRASSCPPDRANLLDRFNFEDIRKLPPPVIAFSDVAFSYSGKKEDYLYQGLSFGIE